MEPLETYPLTLDLTQEWDDEADTKIKASIVSFLTHSAIPASKVASEISLAFKPKHNISGFRDEVEDICIYISKYLPVNHVSQDRLVEVVQAVRELPQKNGQPDWRYIFQDGCSMLMEAEGAQDLCRLHEDTLENIIKGSYLRNLHAFMARLTRKGISDCSYQALQSFTQALETAEPHAATRMMDMLIVYDWVRSAGKQLMEAQLNNAEVGRELWDSKHKPGFSPERWNFWRDRLGVIEKNEEHGDEARGERSRQESEKYFGAVDGRRND